MSASKAYKVIIAEQAPIISAGISYAIRKIQNFRTEIFEIGNKASLLQEVARQKIDLLIANPTFGGLLYPDEIRKISINPDIKIYAIEYGKLNSQTLALYEDHIHVTDDLIVLANKIMPKE